MHCNAFHIEKQDFTRVAYFTNPVRVYIAEKGVILLSVKLSLFLGGALLLKSKLYGRVANLRLAQDFMTDWVSSPSTGGSEENRTPVQKSIHTASPSAVAYLRSLAKPSSDRLLCLVVPTS